MKKLVQTIGVGALVAVLCMSVQKDNLKPSSGNESNTESHADCHHNHSHETAPFKTYYQFKCSTCRVVSNCTESKILAENARARHIREMGNDAYKCKVKIEITKN